MQSTRGPDYANQDWELAVREGFQEEAMFHCWLRDQQREQAKGRMACEALGTVSPTIGSRVGERRGRGYVSRSSERV